MGRFALPVRLAPALLLVLLGLASLRAPVASAQESPGLVERDGSLGTGDLEVGPGTDPLGQPATYLITPEMGEQRDRNLFHSFGRFGIGSGETATFTGPDPIEGPQSVSNVISRVTGGNPSEIEGTLRATIPGADVWLFNPSGVVFGAGAVLDVKGSFHAGTGDYVGFEGGLERFYGDPSLPSVLATAPPAAFGFLPGGGAASLAAESSRLAAPDGETLELVAGDLSLTGAELLAPGGHVGLEAQRQIGLSGSVVDVGKDGDTPGTVSIHGGQIVIEQGSQVLAENESTRPSADLEKPGPGSISVDASESVRVDASLLSVSTQGVGKAGTIQVASPVVTFQNGPGYDPTKPPLTTEVGASAETTASGAGGEIQIHAGELVTLMNGVGVSATAVGSSARGKAGTVEIIAQEVVVGKDSYVSAETAGAGAGGSISIAAGKRVDVDGGLLSVSTWSDGKAGTIHIGGLGDGGPSPDVTFQHGPGIGNNFGDPRVTEVGARAETKASGAGGTIEIDAHALVLVDGVSVATHGVGSLNAPYPARGPGGRVEIVADSVDVSDRSFISTGSWGSTGKGGTITIDLGDDGSLRVDGRSPDGTVGAPYTWIIASSNGTPGNIEIHAGSVEVSNGRGIVADCNANCARTKPAPGAPEPPPNVWIKADEIRLDFGGISATTHGVGDGGRILIDAGSVAIGSGGRIDATTDGPGNAGTITIEAESVELGKGGFIKANSREVVSGEGGNAGTIEVTARESILLDHEDGPPFSLLEAAAGTLEVTGIFSATGAGKGGSITLNAPDITVTNGAIVATSTVGGGDAGNVFLSGDRIHILDGGFVDSTSVPSPTSRRPGGAAGSVTLDANELIEVAGRRRVMPGETPYEEWSRVGSAALGSGAPGTVTLEANRVVVDGGAVATTAIGSARAQGAVTIAAGELLVANGGRIDASTFVADTGGSIDLTATRSIAIAGGGSIESRTGGQGKGGDLVLRAPRIEVKGGGEVSAESKAGLLELQGLFAGLVEEGLIPAPPAAATGDAGSILLAATKLVHLDDGDVTTSSPEGSASGGNITIDPVFVILQHASGIVANADRGYGGRIRIAADGLFQFPGSVISAASGNPELSGTVEIHSPDVNLAGTLAPLPSTFLDAASLMRERCAARRSGERAGSFSVRGPGGIAAEPDGWLPAPLVLETAAIGAAAPAPPALVASLPGPLLAHGTCP